MNSAIFPFLHMGNRCLIYRIISYTHFINQLHPDQHARESLERVGSHPLPAQTGGKEVGRRHTCQHKHKNKQRDIPTGTLPRSRDIPKRNSDESNDIRTRLAPRTEEYDKKQNRGKKGIAEGFVSILRYPQIDRKSTRLNSSHANISYAVFCLKKKKTTITVTI